MKQPEAQTAIVTGVSSGIELGVTQALLERGWQVVVTALTINDSKDLKPSAGLILVDGDVSKKTTAVKIVEAVIQHFGRIDLLVNNAGDLYPEGIHRLHQRLQ